MGFFETFLIILILLFVLGPLFRRWLAPAIQRWMLGKMEDNMRRMAGMPTRKQERKARRKASGKGRATRSRATYGEWESAVNRKENPVDFMRSYAEDVEFEEIDEKIKK